MELGRLGAKRKRRVVSTDHCTDCVVSGGPFLNRFFRSSSGLTDTDDGSTSCTIVSIVFCQSHEDIPVLEIRNRLSWVNS